MTGRGFAGITPTGANGRGATGVEAGGQGRHRARFARLREAALLLLALVVPVAGCAASGSGPRPIRPGTDCDACGMEIADLRFGCERRTDDGYLFYDSIECLMSDAAAGGVTWLADYDGSTLHATDSLWVVHGDLPSPMGGGYAAFLDRAAADEVASRTAGRVGRLYDFMADARGASPPAAQERPDGAAPEGPR